MYEDFFAKRVAMLRLQKGISARDMSLTIGQSESYINKIENGKAFPSMQVFFYICEFFKITPNDFFENDKSNPALLQAVMSDLSVLDETQIKNVHEIIKGLKNVKTNP